MIWFNNENFLNESWGFFLHYNYWCLRMLTSQNGISLATYDTPTV
jgi:amino acid permease